MATTSQSSIVSDYHTRVTDMTTALSVVSSVSLVDFVSTNASKDPGNNATPMEDELILDILRDKKIKILEPSIVYIIMSMALGIPGNILVLAVYFQKWQRRSTVRVFIMFLAMFDLLYCLFVHPMELVIIYNPYVYNFPVICKLFRFSSYTIGSTSGLVLVSISVDRFYRICKPLKTQITPGDAKIACVGCLCLALSYAWPSLFIYGVDQLNKTTPMGNVTITPCLFSSGYRSTPYPKMFFIAVFVETFANVIILCVLYSIVGYTSYRREIKWSRNKSYKSRSTESQPKTESSDVTTAFINDGERKTNTNVPTTPILRIGQHVGSQKNNTENEASTLKPIRLHSTISRKRRSTFRSSSISGGKKTTLMLFFTTIVYIISFLPYLGLSTNWVINPGFGKFTPTIKSIYEVAKRSYLINSAVNPFIYSFCNPNFRQDCKKILRKYFICKVFQRSA